MKGIIFGSDHTAALERTYLKYLQQSGTSSEIFPAQQLFLSYYHKGIINKLIFRAGLSAIYTEINTSFKNKIETWQPDFVWVFKGMELLPSTIGWLKKKGIRVINYNPDNPFIFSGRGSGNANVTESMPLFDHYLTYDHEVLANLQGKKIASSLLPFGYDVDEQKMSRIRHETPEKNKACFIGMPDKYRVAFIKKMIAAGVPIDCYGNNWDKYIDPLQAGIFPAQYGDDFLKVLYGYRVQLNYMRPHNLHSHNMRTFEIAGTGGIQLAPRTKDHQSFFEEDREIFLFGSMEECIEKAKGLLALSSADSIQIREQVRERCLREKYTYRDRTEEVVSVINSL